MTEEAIEIASKMKDTVLYYIDKDNQQEATVDLRYEELIQQAADIISTIIDVIVQNPCSN